MIKFGYHFFLIPLFEAQFNVYRLQTISGTMLLRKFYLYFTYYLLCPLMFLIEKNINLDLLVNENLKNKKLNIDDFNVKVPDMAI